MGSQIYVPTCVLCSVLAGARSKSVIKLMITTYIINGAFDGFTEYFSIYSINCNLIALIVLTNLTFFVSISFA